LEMKNESMSAMVIREFGAPEVFGRATVPRPPLREGHVLVRVKASSVNPIDTKIRKGMLARMAPPEPSILGCDVAGIVEAVGAGVTEFAPGDEVYGCTGGVTGYPGALADFTLADAALLAPRPRHLTWEECATIPLVGITAWESLFDRGQLQSGQRVLIHAGVGGVGQMAVQLAAAHGAAVWATTSSSEKAALARELGAHETIDYRTESVADYVARATDGAGFDLVYDTVGGENVARCFTAARVSGTVVSISTRTTADLSPLHAKGLSLHVVFMILPLLTGHGRARHGEILRSLTALAEAGKIKPLLDGARFSFSQVSAAHEHLESGRAVGKIALTHD
jgi:NADPH:quinone reductase